MKDYFTIGEVSKLFDIKVATLRYYDEIGLLHPAYMDEKTNYRYYSTQQFERLNSIKYLRALDLSISKIIDFFTLRDIDSLVSMLKEQQDEVAKQKRNLELIEKKISHRIMQIEDAVHTPLDEITEIKLPEMRLAYLRHQYVLGEDLEHPITKLRNNFGIKGGVFLGKIGISISMAQLKAYNFATYSSVFMVLEEGDQVDSASVIIPAREYLRIRFKGTHMDAAHHYKKLLNFIKDRNYKLIDDSIEITIIDSGLTNDVEKYVTEILLPYKR